MIFSHFIRTVLLFIVYLHLPFTTLSSSEPEDITIDVSQAYKLLHHGYTFLDVRTVEEFEKGHVDSEKVFNVPYWFYTPQGQVNNPNFLKHVTSLFNQTDHLVVGCKSGVRSLYATRVLVSSGFESVRNMDGGYIAWMENNNSLGLVKKAQSNEESVKPSNSRSASAFSTVKLFNVQRSARCTTPPTHTIGTANRFGCLTSLAVIC